MLTRAKIKAHCFSTTYQRGWQLFASHSCRSLSITDASDDPYWNDDDEITVFGQVKGSGSKWYHSQVTISREDTIIDYECECPAYNNYYGMCKHCVALALQYQSEQDDAGDGAFGAASGQELFLDETRKVREKEKLTSAALEMLMENSERRGRGYIFEGYKADIDFIPQFSMNYNGSLKVEFKIGAQRKIYCEKYSVRAQCNGSFIRIFLWKIFKLCPRPHRIYAKSAKMARCHAGCLKSAVYI